MTAMLVYVALLVILTFPMVTLEGFKDFNPMKTAKDCSPGYAKTVLSSDWKLVSKKPMPVFTPFIKGIQPSKLALYIKKIVPTKIADNAEAMQNVVDLAKTASEIVYGLNIATQVLGVAIPFVGATSLVLGFLSDYRSAEHTKTELLREVNSALSILTDSVNTRFDEMKTYVDESVIALEKSILDGEYQHMYNYLANCLEENDFGMRQTCMVDRCGYVKAGLPKFAIYMNSIKIMQKPTISMIKRIDANVPLLFTYITSLLIPCETILYTHKLFQATSTIVDESDEGDEKENKEDLGNFFATKTIKDSDGNIVKKSTGELIVEYIKTAGEKIYNALEDPEPMAQSRLVNKKKEIQCRALMSKYNTEQCDWLMSEGDVNIAIKAIKKNIDQIDDDTRDSFCRTGIWWNFISSSVYPKELQKQIKTIWDSYENEIKTLFDDIEKKKTEIQEKLGKQVSAVLSRDNIQNTTNINSTIIDLVKNILPNHSKYGENVTSKSQSPPLVVHINAAFLKNVSTNKSQSMDGLHNNNAKLSTFAKKVFLQPSKYGNFDSARFQLRSGQVTNSTMVHLVKDILPHHSKYDENVTPKLQPPPFVHINATNSDYVKKVLSNLATYRKKVSAIRSQLSHDLHSGKNFDFVKEVLLHISKHGHNDSAARLQSRSDQVTNSAMAHLVKSTLPNHSTYRKDKLNISQATTGQHYSYNPHLYQRKHIRLYKPT